MQPKEQGDTASHAIDDNDNEDIPFAMASLEESSLSPLECIAVIPIDGPCDVPIAMAPQMVTVIAPATLLEGYSFLAQVDGMDFDVVVPPGGVLQGQAFQVPYPAPHPDREIGGCSSMQGSQISPQPQHALIHASELVHVPPSSREMPAVPSDAPMGKWRTKLCSCWSTFPSNLFWAGLFLTPILVGQVAQRMGLDYCGKPIPVDDHENDVESARGATSERGAKGSSTCQSIALVFTVANICNFMAVGIVVWPITCVLCVILISNVRYHFRVKYQIPGTCCNNRCDDVCCALFCDCCVAVQLTRHTHNEDRYPYQCCSEIGLSETAPPV